MEHKEVRMTLVAFIANADILLLPLIFLSAFYLAGSQ